MDSVANRATQLTRAKHNKLMSKSEAAIALQNIGLLATLLPNKTVNMKAAYALHTIMTTYRYCTLALEAELKIQCVTFGCYFYLQVKHAPNDQPRGSENPRRNLMKIQFVFKGEVLNFGQRAFLVTQSVSHVWRHSQCLYLKTLLLYKKGQETSHITSDGA